MSDERERECERTAKGYDFCGSVSGMGMEVCKRIVWSSEKRAKGGCLGTRKAKKVVVSCEKPRGAASKL